MKKSAFSLLASLSLLLGGFASTAHAASIANGTACATVGATSSVKVKGVSKVYVCKVNPSIAGASTPTWTLKTCLSYWAAAQNSQDSINQQRGLVSSMSEPDKTTYTKQLNASQASLDKVKVAIKANHCKVGL
jgi:hypothetical protein